MSAKGGVSMWANVFGINGGKASSTFKMWELGLGDNSITIIIAI